MSFNIREVVSSGAREFGVYSLGEVEDFDREIV